MHIAVYKDAIIPSVQSMQSSYICSQGEKAIWSPWTGIVDWAVVCQHFANDFQKMGGEIFLNFEVTGFAEMTESKEQCELSPIFVQSKNRVSIFPKLIAHLIARCNAVVSTSNVAPATFPLKCIVAKNVLTCAGLHSDRLAVMTGCDLSPRIIPFRGEYLLLNENKRHLSTTNVYPVPDPRFPFLGVHFTPKMNSDIWLGPNAILAFAREGYRCDYFEDSFFFAKCHTTESLQQAKLRNIHLDVIIYAFREKLTDYIMHEITMLKCEHNYFSFSWFDINIRDCVEMAKFPGLYKLCFRYFIPGCKEVIKSIFYPLTVRELQKFIPEITYKDVKRSIFSVR